MLLRCLLAASTVLVAGASALAQQTETIRLTVASSHPIAIPWALAMKNTVVAKTNKALEAKGSKYRIEWNESYGGVLFNFENTIEAVEQGIADFVWVGSLWEPAKMPLQNIMFATPFVTDDPKIAIKVMHEMMAKNKHFQREWESQSAVYFGASAADSYQLFTKFPVNKLEDLKGKKILGAGSVGVWIDGLGATFVNSGLPAFYNALQTGVGEGLVLLPSGAVPIKVYELAPYVTYINLGAVSFGGFAANKQRWDSLPKEVRDVLGPIAREYADENVRIVLEREQAGVETMTKAGAKLNKLPDAELKRMAAAMPNLAKSYAEELEKKGIPGKEIVKEWMATMRAHGATPARDWDKDL